MKMLQLKSFGDQASNGRNGIRGSSNYSNRSLSNVGHKQGQTRHCNSKIHQPCIAQRYDPFTMKLNKTEDLSFTPHPLNYLPRNKPSKKSACVNEDQIKHDIKQKLLKIIEKRRDIEGYDTNENNSFHSYISEVRPGQRFTESSEINFKTPGDDMRASLSKKTTTNTVFSQTDIPSDSKRNFGNRSITNEAEKARDASELKKEAENIFETKNNHLKNSKSIGENGKPTTAPRERERFLHETKSKSDNYELYRKSPNNPSTRIIPIELTHNFLRTKIRNDEIIRTQ